MKAPRGFIGIPALLAIFLVLVATMGGTYYYLENRQSTPNPQLLQGMQSATSATTSVALDRFAQGVQSQGDVATSGVPQTLSVEGQILQLVPIPPGFPTDSSYFYYKNSQYVYFYAQYSSTTRIEGADARTFSVDIPKNIDMEYAIDNHAVYFLGKRMLTLPDPATQFVILDPGHEQDCGHPPYVEITNADGSKFVFFGDTLIPGADADSFVVLGFLYSKDKNYVYYETNRTSDDSKTFGEAQAYANCPLG